MKAQHKNHAKTPTQLLHEASFTRRHPLETALFVATVAAIWCPPTQSISFFSASAPVPLHILLVALVFSFFSAHVLFEAVRWQLAVAYVAAGYIVCGTALSPPFTFQLSLLAQILMSVLLVLSFIYARWIQPVFTLPLPTGKFKVIGTTRHHFVGTSKRRLPVDGDDEILGYSNPNHHNLACSSSSSSGKANGAATTGAASASQNDDEEFDLIVQFFYPSGASEQGSSSASASLPASSSSTSAAAGRGGGGGGGGGSPAKYFHRKQAHGTAKFAHFPPFMFNSLTLFSTQIVADGPVALNPASASASAAASAEAAASAAPFKANNDKSARAGGDNGGGRFPVIMFSHGLGGVPETYHVAAQDLASHGFIVVAVTHTDASSSMALSFEESRAFFSSSSSTGFASSSSSSRRPAAAAAAAAAVGDGNNSNGKKAAGAADKAAAAAAGLLRPSAAAGAGGYDPNVEGKRGSLHYRPITAHEFKTDQVGLGGGWIGPRACMHACIHACCTTHFFSIHPFLNQSSKRATNQPNNQPTNNNS